MRELYPLWNKNRIVYLWNDDCELRIGSDDDDVTVIKNYPKLWLEYIKWCDGQQSMETIERHFNRKYNISEEKTRGFIQQFKDKNMIQMLHSAVEDNDSRLWDIILNKGEVK